MIGLINKWSPLKTMLLFLAPIFYANHVNHELDAVLLTILRAVRSPYQELLWMHAFVWITFILWNYYRACGPLEPWKGNKKKIQMAFQVQWIWESPSNGLKLANSSQPLTILEMELLIFPFARGSLLEIALFWDSDYLSWKLARGLWFFGIALWLRSRFKLSLRLSRVFLASSRVSMRLENKDIANFVLSIFGPSLLLFPFHVSESNSYLWFFAALWGTAGFPPYRLKNYLLWSVQFPFWLIMKLLTIILIGRYIPIHFLTFVAP